MVSGFGDGCACRRRLSVAAWNALRGRWSPPQRCGAGHLGGLSSVCGARHDTDMNQLTKWQSRQWQLVDGARRTTAPAGANAMAVRALGQAEGTSVLEHGDLPAGTSTNPDPAVNTKDLLASPGRTNRDRRRIEREVCRVLDESRAVVLCLGFVVLSHVCWFALLMGDGRLTLVAGALAVGFFVAMAAHAEPAPDPRPKGEMARMSEPEFEQLVAFVEQEATLLATATTAAPTSYSAVSSDGFERLVSEALDDLPEFMRVELERDVAVVISDDGDSQGTDGYYGLYIGGTVANRGWRHQIVIFRDTLLRDYGSDPRTLRRLVTMTVRHEMAHHLGAGEGDVAELGLYDLAGPRPPKPWGASSQYLASGHPAVVDSEALRSTALSSRCRRGHAAAHGSDYQRPPASSTQTGSCRPLVMWRSPDRAVSSVMSRLR